MSSVHLKPAAAQPHCERYEVMRPGEGKYSNVRMGLARAALYCIKPEECPQLFKKCLRYIQQDTKDKNGNFDATFVGSAEALGLKQCVKDAIRKNPQAELVMGVIALYGTCPDTASSMKTFAELKKIAEKGNPYAQLALGSYMQKRFLKGEIAQIVDLFTKAANQGMVYACMQLSYIHMKGQLGQVDTLKSLYWFKKALENFDETLDDPTTFTIVIDSGVIPLLRNDLEGRGLMERLNAQLEQKIDSLYKAPCRYIPVDLAFTPPNRESGFYFIKSASSSGNADADRIFFENLSEEELAAGLKVLKITKNFLDKKP